MKLQQSYENFNVSEKRAFITIKIGRRKQVVLIKTGK